MYRTLSVIAMTLVFLQPNFVAEAATVLWSTDTPVLWQDFDVDFEGELSGITSVEVRMAGYGGGQHGYCQDMGGDDTYFWLNFTVTFQFEGSTGGFTAPVQTAYDLSAGLALTPGTTDWGFLADGRAVMHISYDDNYDFDMIDCYPIGYEVLTAESLVIEITCDTAIPNDPVTWSAVKNLYR